MPTQTLAELRKSAAEKKAGELPWPRRRKCRRVSREAAAVEVVVIGRVWRERRS